VTFDEKIQMLHATIETQATWLGLVFVSGPGPESLPPELALPDNVDVTNGQPRQVYSFSVAEGGGSDG
jgi:hypothetical protein